MQATREISYIRVTSALPEHYLELTIAGETNSWRTSHIHYDIEIKPRYEVQEHHWNHSVHVSSISGELHKCVHINSFKLLHSSSSEL